jgi:putative membrane protein
MKHEFGRTWPSLSLAMLGVWIACALASAFLPNHPAVGGVGLLASIMFGLFHGTRRFGIPTSLAFFAIAVVVANCFENLSITTGFPFGSFTHGTTLGPKLLLVPVVVGPIYYSACYIAWTLANMLLGDPAHSPDRFWTLAMPVIAAFIVVGFDLCGDPIGATIAHHWHYPNGGAFFGVPLSNFLGWYLTTWVIFQLFAIYLAVIRSAPKPLGLSDWYEAAGFWAAMALQFPLLLLRTEQAVVQDPGGWSWRTTDILQTATIIGIYTMLSVAVTSILVVRQRYESPVAGRKR